MQDSQTISGIQCRHARTQRFHFGVQCCFNSGKLIANCLNILITGGGNCQIFLLYNSIAFVGVIGKNLIVFFSITIQIIITHGEKHIMVKFNHVSFVITNCDLCKVVCIQTIQYLGIIQKHCTLSIVSGNLIVNIFKPKCLCAAFSALKYAVLPEPLYWYRFLYAFGQRIKFSSWFW